MRVKGTAFHARLHLLKHKLGEHAVEAFIVEFRRTHPEFPTSVLPTSQIPAETFLQLNDTIVEQVYGGDTDSLWELGALSAEWSLTEGPYKGLLEGRDVTRFAAMAPVMWSNFFDTGRARTEVHPDRIELYIEGVPAGLRHLYFEYSVIGYFRRGLEMLGGAVRMERVTGFSAGDADVHYRLHLTAT